MIYLITGVPGSGKTLYAVSTLIAKLLAEKVKKPDGSDLERRLLVDGIPDLLLPHEILTLMVEDEKKQGVWTCAGDGLVNWPTWCRPGDVIVIDEVQRYWRPRSMGTKPPAMVTELETHRHYGIDFVIITQNPMLIDQNVRRLVGRHQHIRRLFGMARAVIYDWDACSADVNRTATATVTTWGYPKSAYALYKSSALHLKQRQKVPLWLVVPVLAIAGLVAVMPTAFSTMRGAMSGQGVSRAAVAPAPAASAPKSALDGFTGDMVAKVPSAAASVPVTMVAAASNPSDKPVVSGCFAYVKKCVCMDASGFPLNVEPGFCEAQILGNSMPGQKADISNLEYSPNQVARSFPGPWEETDTAVLSFIAKRSRF